PLLLINFRSGLDSVFDTRIIESKIESSKSFDGFIQRSLNIDGLSHVAPDGKGTRSQFFNQTGGFLIPFFVNIRDCDVCTFASKCHSSRAANSAAGAWDKSHFVFEIFTHIWFMPSRQRLRRYCSSLTCSIQSTTLPSSFS